MRTFFIGFVVFLLYTIPARWHYVCQIRNLCEDNSTDAKILAGKAQIQSELNTLDSTATLADSIRLATEIPNRNEDLSIIISDSFALEGYEQFGFLPNSATLELTPNNKKLLEKLKEYLEKHPDRRLGITGNSYEFETVSEGMIDNIGIARAASIRDYLVSEYGFTAERFKLEGNTVKRTDNLFLDKPIEYDIIVPKLDAKKGSEGLVEAGYTLERMTFSDINFEYNQAKFQPSRSFEIYADSIKTFLKLNPKKTLTVVGHTDNRGTEDYNAGLGFSRARNVSVYLIERIDIDVDRIKYISEGEKQPIAPNTTDQNMRKNRRVEVIIK